MPKKLINLRIGSAQDEWIGQVEAETQAGRSVVARCMLSVATSHRAEVISKVRAALLAEGEAVGRG